MKRLSDRYTAGIIDGEGCVGIKVHSSAKAKNGGFYYTPYVKVVMCDYIVPEMLKHSFKGNTWERKRTDGWKSSLEWLITGKPKCSSFLKRIRKYLLVKRRQADLIIKFCELTRSHTITTTEQKDLDDIYQEIRKLNSRIKSPATTN
jgi:hypothetical protein